MDNAIITVEEIANFLNSKYFGMNFPITQVCSADAIKANAISFRQKKSTNVLPDSTVLWLVEEPPLFADSFTGAYIVTENPKLAYAKVVQEFFVSFTKQGNIAKSARLGDRVQLGQGVSIGEGTVIEDNVEIGDNTVIKHNVVIAANTVIGKSCYIKSGAVIGEEGFGFAFDKNNVPVRVPHLGRVIIGNNVEIGAKSTINRGTIGNTMVGDYVKIDDQVHIAHNCQIGENTIITACAEVSGSVTIGKNCWIAPNVSIIQKVSLGDNVKIGIGVVVLKNVKNGSILMDIRKIIDLSE